MFGNGSSKPEPWRKTWDNSNRDYDDESWGDTTTGGGDTTVAAVQNEPFTLFGFKLFESEATLQVNRSAESDTDSTGQDDDEEDDEDDGRARRGFFQRLWEGPTENTDSNGESVDDDEDEDESDSEDDEPIVPPRRVGVALQRAPHPFSRPSPPPPEDNTDRSITASLSKNLLSVLSGDQPVPAVKEAESKSAKAKRRFWKRKNKSNTDSPERNERKAGPIWGQEHSPQATQREPSSNLLKRIAAEQSMFKDRRDDDDEDAQYRTSMAHERYTYEPEGNDREEQELFKCFPSMNLGGGGGGHYPIDASNRSAIQRRSFLGSRQGNKFDFGDTFADTSSKKCFPSWPSPLMSFEAPSDLTNSTDGNEGGSAYGSRRGRRSEQNSISPYADYAPRPPPRPTPKTRTAAKQARVPVPQPPPPTATHKKRQLNDLLAKYQQDYSHDKDASRKPISLPPKSKTKTKSKASSHHPSVKRNQRNQGSWDEHSGWFTLGSLDVV